MLRRNSSDGNSSILYNRELGTNKLQIGAKYCYSQNNNSTAQACTENDLSYKDQIGLMYISDYAYADDPKYWNEIMENLRDYDVDPVKSRRSTSWMQMGIGEWLISRNYIYGMLAYIASDGIVSQNYISGNFYAVRPSFYLTNDTKLVSGDGTKANPYRLKFSDN